MTSIAAAVSSYTPPVSAPAPTPAATAAPVQAAPATDSDGDTDASTPASDATEAANTNAPQTYNELASASTSNIRGSVVNTTA